MKKLTKMFLELARLDSPSGEEVEVRKYLIDHLEKLGLKCVIDEAGNVFSKVIGKSDPILLCAHMDTVEPGRGISPVIENGILKSSGETILGADNKAALAAILDVLYRSNKDISLEILFTVREETDGGINEFDLDILQSKQGIIADRSAPIGSIVTSSPWIVDLQLTCIGSSAHSATPEKGLNAFNGLLNIFAELKPGRLDEDTTFNIGKVIGGDATNTIPEKVVVKGEMRSFQKKSLDYHISRFRDAVSEQNRIKTDLAITPYGSGYNYSEDHPAVQRIASSMHKLGITPTYERSFGGSDVNALIDHGVNAVNIGDGSKFSHTIDEQISIDDLELLSELIFKYITNDQFTV